MDDVRKLLAFGALTMITFLPALYCSLIAMIRQMCEAKRKARSAHHG